MGSLLKKFVYSCIGIFIFSLTLCYSSYAGTYINTYYKDDVSEEISKGVSHISGVRLTNNGLIRTEIVKVDLSNNKLEFKNVFNSDSMGKKTTLNNLVKREENVVAAINGDFFEMSLAPSFELGMTINDGKIEKLSSGEYYNCYSDSLAELIMDNNDPSIEFVKSNIIFENDNDQLYVSYYNKAGDKIGTVILDSDYFTTSYSMDNRNPNTYKIVVKKGKKYDEIISIIEPGTSIDIEEGTYVVFLPVAFERIDNFSVGDHVSLTIDLSIDQDVDMAIGGAGVFLQNGKIVANGYIVSSTTARSFVGYDSRKDYLYFGTVGGLTSTNAGVTSSQLGEILLDYGVYNAMHLDGGGSSTLITKNAFNSSLHQVNDVKSQRAIINALVVTNDATSTKLSGIEFDINNKAVYNVAVPYKVYGYDENHKELSNYKNSNVKITADKDIDVDYSNMTITFREKGRTTLNVTASNYSKKIPVDIYETLSEIQILPDPILLDVNEEVELNIIAFTGENYKIPIDASSCDFVISPSNIAKVKNNKIIGTNNGVGIVTVYYDGLSASSIISVGKETILLDNFNKSDMTAVSYPEDVYCDIDVDGELTIDYEFYESEETQAAYAKYNSKLELPSGATSLLVSVKGDGKGCMLKVSFVDSNGESYNQVACNNLSSRSKKEYEVQLPTSYNGTLYIDRYYVVTVGSNKNIKSTVTIDDVKCIKSLNYKGVSEPKSITREITSYNKDIINFDDSDFIFYNNSGKSLMTNYLNLKLSQVLSKYNDRKLVLSKNTDNLVGIINNDGLKQYSYDKTLMISMSTINGSAFAKDPYQYGQIENIINNSNVENVIITLDGDLNTSALAKDKTMLDYILNKCYQEKRINYYVIMFAGTTSSDIISNGIRYIRIPKTINDVFGNNVLVIRNQDDDISYNFVSYAEVIKEYESILLAEKEELEETEEDKENDTEEFENNEDSLDEEGGENEE